jgi:transcriptional regulator
MYIRPSHQPRDSADVVQVIRQNMFATLVTSSPTGLIATHLPFVFDETLGEHGTLYAHMARANEQGTVVANGSEVLVTFTGPHAYISPSWYADRATAPTWDYVAVHCYGIPRLHDQEESLRNIERLIAVVEAGRLQPWSMQDLSDEEIRMLIWNVVSFEIPVSRLEAKFKLNRGERPDRTADAIAQLEQQGDGALAAWIRRYNDLPD